MGPVSGDWRGREACVDAGDTGLFFVDGWDAAVGGSPGLARDWVHE